MVRIDMKEAYFNWLCEQVEATDPDIKLLYLLDHIPFTYSVPFDDNRYEDGIDLRYRFGYAIHAGNAMVAEELDDHECSVLEMLIALSIRCEEQIMMDIDKGSRVGKWFWSMISNLGLKPYGHSISDKQMVETIVRRFLERRYKPSGEGGLFTIPNTKRDLRTVEIWTQLMWWINYIDERGET